MEQPRLEHVQCLNAQGLHRMAYWEWGDPANSRVLLCVHGLTRQGRDFDHLARTLSSHYRVVCPDVVGRGHSDWLSEPMGYGEPQYAADMTTLIARLNPSTLDWVGTSMGGLIGMGLAARKGSPIRRMVLNDVGPRIEYSALARIGTYVGLPVSWPTPEAAADALWTLSQGFGPHTSEQWMELCRPQLRRNEEGRWISHYDPRIGVPFKALTPELTTALEAHLWQNWDKIVAQTLVLRGAQSDLLSAETASQMAQRGPRSQTIEFQGVGHAPTLIAPDQIQAVSDFLLAA